jgi:DNA polymerase I-like protein with 3'-5' exonuclease and polymerase domains
MSDLFPTLEAAEEVKPSKIAMVPRSGSTWKPPKLSSLPSWYGAKKVSIDTETKDPYLKKLGSGCRRPDSYVVGYSFHLEDGPSFYIPFKHEAGGNVDFDHAKQYLQDQAKFFSGELIGMNLSYDLDWLRHDLEVEFKKVRFFRDIGTADPLIFELHDFYNMNAIAERHGIKPKDETLLLKRAEQLGLHPKSDLWKMHSEDVGDYAQYDAELPMLILAKQQKLIDAHNLQDIFDLESQVLPVLLKMRQRGVRIDEKKLEEVENFSLQEEAKELRTVQELTGVKIKLGDVWKAVALAPAFEAVGIVLPRTATGKYSIKKDDVIAYDHPVADALQRARVVNKLRTSFAQSIRNHMVNGRIHCTFNQIARETESGDQKGARYGRLSCIHPNMQQQPSRGEFAELWRSIYIPEDGAIWSCNDYSQQEPRWTTHFANMMKYPKASEAAAEYRNNPLCDNHDMMAKLTGVPRKEAKAIYLGLCYGEGGAKLCNTLGLPTRWCLSVGDYKSRRVYYFDDEKSARFAAKLYKEKKFLYECAGEKGQAILDQFDERAPFIKKLAKRVQAKANEVGFIRTVGGRRLNFVEKGDASGYDFTYRALNRLIQGSSADQMKRAMVEIDAHMPDFYLQLQVHDELDSSASSPTEAVKASEIMKEAILSTVPFRVDVDLGPNWGQLQSLEKYLKGAA